MDKVIVITGGGRGIGAATALLAAAQGYRICINYQSDEQAAHSVLEQVRALGAQAIAVRADVSIEDEVIAMFQRVDSELGRVTALVNNAGTVGQKSRVDEMSEFRILKIMKTNVLAPILCAKHAILRMSQTWRAGRKYRQRLLSRRTARFAERVCRLRRVQRCAGHVHGGSVQGSRRRGDSR